MDATVDFSNIGQQSVAVSPDRTSATITVPHAVLSPAAIDAGRSYVADRDRGLLDRIGSVFSYIPTSERGLVQIAERRVAEADAGRGQHPSDAAGPAGAPRIHRGHRHLRVNDGCKSVGPSVSRTASAPSALTI